MDGYEKVSAAFDQPDEISPYDRAPEMPSDDGGRAPRTPQLPLPPSMSGIAAERAAECAFLPLNDYGNGKRFTVYFGEDVLYVPRVGWFVWDGRCWAQDDDALEVRRLAQKVSGKVTAEAAFLALEPWECEQIEVGEEARDELEAIKGVPASQRSDAQKAQMKEYKEQIDRANALKKKLASMRTSHHSHAKAAGNTGPINNLMKEAQVDLYYPLDKLNANKIMLNVGNCVLSFREQVDAAGVKTFVMDIQDHKRELLLTKIMNVDYDPRARCPEFMAFLEVILPSPELREFIQRWFGYSLTGLTTEQKLAFLYGSGRNGKSTLVDLIAKMMGRYAATVPIESLAGSEQRKGSDATPDLVALPGARMVRASEPERGQKMKEALIKQLTGGEEILVRRMMQEFVQVVPEFSLTIQGNYKPEIRGTDNGIWRRVLLVPFLAAISDEDKDALLPEKLWAERSGVLNWLLEGTRKWLETGLMIPEQVINATQEYREESDPVLTFINDCCVVDGVEGGSFTRAVHLGNAFNWWYVSSGLGSEMKPITIYKNFKDKTAFFETKDGLRFEHRKSNGNTGWKGIRLSDAFVQHREDEESAGQFEKGVGADPVV